MIAAGATVVESRELLRRLKAAGLRLTPAQRREAADSARGPGGVTSAVAHPDGRVGS
jgi:hypothetical protein